MNVELVKSLDEISREKGIDKELLYNAVEAALISAYRRNFGTSQNVKVIINRETGDVKVYAMKKVVEQVEDPNLEIDVEEAKAMDVKYELDDVIDIEVTPKNFGRIAAQTAKQVVIQRIREAEREVVYEDFLRKEQDIVTGIVQRIDKGNVYVDLGRTEGILTPSEQISSEKYNFNDRIKAYVLEVKKTTKGPKILLSRTHPGLIKRLFELEVPEIHDGIVEIKSISREPGSRTKIAVYSNNKNVDPVGACVGHKGARVQAIVNELNGEKIDINEWSEDPAENIANALSPAKVLNVKVNEKEKSAEVIVPDYQLSLAIGKEGQNVRLAAKLTGWKIDIKKQSDVDNIEELRGDEGKQIEDLDDLLESILEETE